MKTSLGATETEIWSRTIRPDIGGLAPAVARELLQLRLATDDVERVRELSDKANDGALRAEEEQELDAYLNVGRALEFLKAKAHLSLRNGTASD